MDPRPAGRIALVVEGGAMRGIFAAGVLDVFLEQRFRPFELALGVSVGASNLLSYLAGQHGRARRCFLDQMSRPEFIDPWRMLRGGHWLDLDWLWGAITREDPLDCSAAAASGVEYTLVATCARTGEPRYLDAGCGRHARSAQGLVRAPRPLSRRRAARRRPAGRRRHQRSPPRPRGVPSRRAHARRRSLSRGRLREEGPPSQSRRRMDDARHARHRPRVPYRGCCVPRRRRLPRRAAGRLRRHPGGPDERPRHEPHLPRPAGDGARLRAGPRPRAGGHRPLQ